MAHNVQPLPYAYDGLEPFIDEATMKLHHDKHHVTYATNFNLALEKHPELISKNPEELLSDLALVPEDIRLAVRNHGGGFVNHAMFWEIMAPHAGGKPTGDLLKALEKAFGSYEKFVEQFEQAATTQFGSGWAWLALAAGKLVVEKTPNQDSPLSQGHVPLLCLDVWEHAYYLKYQNRRVEYVKAWWNVVNWGKVEKMWKTYQ